MTLTGLLKRAAIVFIALAPFLCLGASAQGPQVTNQCISFTVGPGTGCAWMCAHCADALGPAYYFPDGVCAYQGGGCVGSPLAGVTYTCCAAARAAPRAPCLP
ncbi:MAG: hypothetical protein EBS05_27015 [Proteobacteria bacterium]|nr:hypothetical protein [Pseudomonadota bacterium]